MTNDEANFRRSCVLVDCLLRSNSAFGQVCTLLGLHVHIELSLVPVSRAVIVGGLASCRFFAFVLSRQGELVVLVEVLGSDVPSSVSTVSSQVVPVL